MIDKKYAALIILAAFAIGFYFYPSMPEEMASHWNKEGKVDDYSSRFIGLFLMPIMMTIAFLFFLAIPYIDPLKKNINKFKKQFNGLVFTLLAFLLYIQILSISWNLGVEYNMNRALAPAMGLLFYYLGVVVQHAKRNWFVGIRTPWTLSSERVWTKTHKLGGKLFKIAGIIAFTGVIFPKIAAWLIVLPVISTALSLIVYSYIEYRRS